MTGVQTHLFDENAYCYLCGDDDLEDDDDDWDPDENEDWGDDDEEDEFEEATSPRFCDCGRFTSLPVCQCGRRAE